MKKEDVIDLLKPRYKVIADYPDSIFKVGGILVFQNRADKEFSITEEYFFLKNNTAFGETYLQKYPQVQFIKEYQEDYYCVVIRSVEEFLMEVKQYLKS